ncbi:MAG: glycosyltransferase family 39 protein [Verrucomicrobiaceae bacterium]|nr:glycosyltransferase family 39 protein [Verrucomicrobiaceae bacterium]
MRPLLHRRRLTWLVFLGCLILNVVFVTTRGAWESDLAGDPDEAAHAVTALMLRDYLAGGWRQHPLAFAEQYYADFPKVALGHYPPGFYLLAGTWLLPHASISSLFLLQAVLGAALCSVVFRITSKSANNTAGLLAAALMALLPVGLKQMQLVMSDLLLALLGLAAALLWRDYLNRPTARRALGFGFITAAAILTKGSALGLCVIPPLATLACARFDLLKKLSWWLCGAPVALLAGPWMLYSSRITAEGMLHVPLARFVPEAAAYYLRTLPHALGWPLAVLGPAGAAWLMLRPNRCPRPSQAAALGALACGTLLVVLLVPAGMTARYLLPCLPVLVTGAVMILHPVMRRNTWGRVLGLLIAGVCLFFMPGWPEKRVDGFSAAVQRSGMPALDAPAPQNWLVASDPRGEGAVIAATAFACPRRSPSLLRVYRGSKELAQSDWMGRGYQPAHADASSLLAHLDRRGITRVFVDLSVPETMRKEHEKRLETALQAATDRWKLDFEQPVTREPGKQGRMLVFTRW